VTSGSVGLWARRVVVPVRVTVGGVRRGGGEKGWGKRRGNGRKGRSALWSGMALQARKASAVWKGLRSMLQVAGDWRGKRAAEWAVVVRAKASREVRIVRAMLKLLQQILIEDV